MLLIPCPWCGPRDEFEFRCGGQSHLPRPGTDCSDADWSDYLFTRDNPKGWHRERWLHVYGCRQWFHLLRSTVTHEIAGAYRYGEPPLEPPSGDRAVAVSR